jgi:hypothetical protein
MFKFLTAAKDFQVNGISFGDIRPENIVVTKDKNLKMINTASFPWEITAL